MAKEENEHSKPLEVIRRIHAIVTIIDEPGNGPKNMEDFIERLSKSDDFGAISERTLYRYFEYLRLYFGIDIKYNRSKRCFEKNINTDEEPDNERLKNLVAMVSMAGQMDYLVSHSWHLKNMIHYEFENSLLKVRKLVEMLSAYILKFDEISFDYQSFKKEEPSNYTLEPYCLAERNNRWYLIGYEKGYKEIRTFGLDRMITESLKTTGKKFNKKKRNFDFHKKFSGAVGIVYNEKGSELIEFKSTHKQAPYVRSLPLHSSQEELKSDKNYVYFSLYCDITFELEMKFLSLGSSVIVISPEHLRKSLKEKIKEMKKNYD